MENLRLASAGAAKKELLWNALQSYLHEMSEVFGLEPQADGSYPYPYFESYFDESEKGRIAKLIYAEDTLIGFALINGHSYTKEPIDHSLAEYAIFPEYRGSGAAAQALLAILNELPGRWQLKYSPRNKRGAAFWRRFTKQFNATQSELGDEMIVSFITHI